MPDSPEVSFVIPSYRSLATIRSVLDAVLRQQTNVTFDVTVVDSSDDGTADRLAKSHPGVGLVRSPTRLSPAAARNRGVLETAGRLLAFVDADAVPAANWLQTLKARLDDPQVVLAGGWVGNANPQHVASRILHWIEFSEVVPGTPSGVRRVLGSSNWLVRRSAFESVRGFPEEFSMAEDLLFCRNLKGKIWFEGGTGVWHRHREDWERVAEHLERLGLWSGRYRARFPASGSFLARAPWLCWGLVPVRLARILGRVGRAEPAEGIRCLARLPALWRGLHYWSRGFRAGIAE